ncbi:MAG TPA: Mrr restriction system protein [Actinomycetota bacterium]
MTSVRERQGEYVRGVIEIVLEHGNEMQASDVLRALAERLELTDYEAGDYPSRPGTRRFEKLVRFATIPAVKAGWLVKTKGIWSVTDAGQEALQKLTDPHAFQTEAVQLYLAWKATQPEPPPDDAAEGDPQGAVVLEEAEEAAWREIEEFLHEQNPYDFQNLVKALLEAMAYHVAWVSPPGPDRGIDVLAFTDPLGASLPRIKVQVKRRHDKIGAPELRSFMAILGEQDVGIVVSLGGFTKEAEVEARGQERRRLTLIDATKLFDLWIGHFDRIAPRDRQLLPLKAVYYLDPDAR